VTPSLSRTIAVASVMLVAVVAAVVSFAHMHDLSLRYGESWRSVLIPLSVDGMLVAATSAIVNQRRQRLPAGVVPWLGLGLGIGASLVANVAAAQPVLIAQLIAGWPPVALAISVETLVVILRGSISVDPAGGHPGHTVDARAPHGCVASSEATVAPRPAVPEVGPTTGAAGVGRVELGYPRDLALPRGVDAVPVVAGRAQLGEHRTVPEDDPVAELIASGAGRGRVARELGITEHKARQLIASHTGGAR
jgi:hypothetical protein